MGRGVLQLAQQFRAGRNNDVTHRPTLAGVLEFGFDGSIAHGRHFAKVDVSGA
jgi:hypothetical protein